MSTVLEVGEMATVTTGMQRVAAPSRRTTTLYDLIAVLQDVAGPDDTLWWLLWHTSCALDDAPGVTAQRAPLPAADRLRRWEQILDKILLAVSQIGWVQLVAHVISVLRVIEERREDTLAICHLMPYSLMRSRQCKSRSSDASYGVPSARSSC
jgi:hypothetical protein